MRKLKFGLLMIAILICAFSISGFSISNIIDPFGTFSNLALTRTDGTALIKISPTVDFTCNCLKISSTWTILNALLNEEEITIDATNMQSAIDNGMHLALPLEVGAYAHLNLFGLHLVPYRMLWKYFCEPATDVSTDIAWQYVARIEC